jgi:hypothetical protein
MRLTQVDPENLMSSFELNSSSFASRKALLKAIQISSVLSISFFYSFLNFSSYICITVLNSFSRYTGSLFLRNVETSLPY